MFCAGGRVGGRVVGVAGMIGPKPELIIDAERLHAYLRLEPWVDYAHLVAEDIVKLLAESEVVMTDDVRGRVGAFLEQLTELAFDGSDFLAAEGVPPHAPVDARLELAEELNPELTGSAASESERIDFYAQCRLALVREGQTIGRIVPAVAAAHGTDIFGKTILARGKPRGLAAGEGVELGEDGATLRALRSGLVRELHGRVEVSDVVAVEGDVDFNTGHIDGASDVVIRGTVRDLFAVRSTRSVSVGGAIESTSVSALGDVVVRGGIAGRDKGSIRAGGTVVCRYCDGARVRAKGDITITKEAIASDLQTRGRLSIPRGQLIGGRAYARLGASIREIGSEAETPTEVIVGLNPLILARAQRMEREAAKRVEAVDRLRENLAPLLADAKRLTADQRARAAELIREIETIQSTAARMTERKERMLEQCRPPAGAALEVTDRIHPRVTLIFEDARYVCRQVIRGPVSIRREPTGYGSATAVFCVNKLSGSRSELRCRKYMPTLPKRSAAVVSR